LEVEKVYMDLVNPKINGSLILNVIAD